MHIELKDEQTGQTHRVEAQGVTLGRDPARATLVLADKGVSSVHAKVYGQDGRFWLEDLKSSNGTYIGEDRINAPHALNPGLGFALYRYRFTVMAVEVANTGESTAVVNLVELGSESSNATKVTGSPAFTTDASEAAAPEAEAAHSQAARLSDDDDEEEDESGDGVEGASFDAQRFIDTVKKATAYYVTNTPKLLLNPTVFVKSTLQEERVEELLPFDLMAWMAPSLVLGMLIQQVALLVAGAVAGAFAPVDFVVMLALAAVASPIIGAIVGFLWHPVLTWFVKLLGGSSTPVSRSNYFVASATALPLVQTASALGILLVLLPIPFVGILPGLLSLAGTLLSLWVAYIWFEHFKVAQGFLVFLLVVGGGLTLLTAWSTYGVTHVAQVMSSPEVKEMLQEGVKASKELAKVAKSVEVQAIATESVAPTKDATPEVMTYQEFLQKREAVEKAVEKDPSLLARKEGALSLYKKLHAETTRVADKYTPKSKKRAPPEDKATKHVREAELYDATATFVAELHRLVVAP